MALRGGAVVLDGPAHGPAAILHAHRPATVRRRYWGQTLRRGHRRWPRPPSRCDPSGRADEGRTRDARQREGTIKRADNDRAVAAGGSRQRRRPRWARTRWSAAARTAQGRSVTDGPAPVRLVSVVSARPRTLEDPRLGSDQRRSAHPVPGRPTGPAPRHGSGGWRRRGGPAATSALERELDPFEGGPAGRGEMNPAHHPVSAGSTPTDAVNRDDLRSGRPPPGSPDQGPGHPHGRSPAGGQPGVPDAVHRVQVRLVPRGAASVLLRGGAPETREAGGVCGGRWRRWAWMAPIRGGAVSSGRPERSGSEAARSIR